MKIIVDGRPIREPLSGSAVFIIELLKGLKLHNISVDLFIQSNQGKNNQILNIDHDSLLSSNGNKTFENIAYELGINKKTEENFLVGHETYFGRLPFKCKNKIATIHDVIPLDFPEWFTWKNSIFAKRNFKRQIKTADYCIFSSQYTKDRVMAHGTVMGESSIIPLAVSNEIHISKNQYMNIGSEKINFDIVKPHSYILAVGNVEPRKNLPLIAKSLNQLNKNLDMNLDLVIAGHANYEAKSIIEEITSNLGKPPITLGFVTNDEKIELYKHAACHVYASKYEGFGIPPVESLVIGTPTVIANNSSLKELIPSKKIAFDAESEESLCSAIENNLYKNSHLVVGESIDKYIEFYSWKRVAHDYLNIYNKLIG